MPYDIWTDLCQLYEERGFSPGSVYRDVTRDALGPGLSYATGAMTSLCEILLHNKRMIAFKLLQNATDEAKGAARICVIADRYAEPELREKMNRHASEDMRHSAQFLDLIRVIGVGKVDRRKIDRSAVVDKMLDFDEEMRAFICRVHSIEIRSWTMLRTYISTLEAKAAVELLRAVPVLEQIMEDEIKHVLYTGRQIDEWMGEDPTLAETLRDCFAHTNRETWHDIASMANYLADNGQVTRGACRQPQEST